MRLLRRAGVTYVVGIALAPGCAPKETLPNVIIITLDTMRADHLGCYGYERNTSPYIDAFAATATRYAKSMAAAPWTVPTHASIFTGKYPFEHGAHSVKVTRQVNNVNPLGEQHVTLAEVFRDEKYTTAAFVANAAFLDPRWQLDQGFDEYNVQQSYAQTLNLRVFKWLDDMRSKPFFLFVNYMDAHRPYNTKPRNDLLDRAVVQDQGALLDSLYNAAMPGTDSIPEHLIHGVIDQYDTAVANLDEQVGRLFAYLRDLGLYDDTIIVLTSDHGEFFGEHHLVEHSKDVYDEVLRVPLVVKGARQTNGQIVETLATSTDIPSLIISQFAFAFATKYLKQFPDAPGNHPVIAENYYTRTKDLFHPVWGKRFNRVRTVYFEWPFKYIRSSDNQHELYNLANDPTEAENTFEFRRRIVDNLDQKLTRFEQSRRREEHLIEQDPLTQEELEKLRSLGYIGN